jgi:hypothetical protein
MSFDEARVLSSQGSSCSAATSRVETVEFLRVRASSSLRFSLKASFIFRLLQTGLDGGGLSESARLRDSGAVKRYERLPLHDGRLGDSSPPTNALQLGLGGGVTGGLPESRRLQDFQSRGEGSLGLGRPQRVLTGDSLRLKPSTSRSSLALEAIELVMMASGRQGWGGPPFLSCPPSESHT